MSNHKVNLKLDDLDIKSDEEIDQLITTTEKVLFALTAELTKRQQDNQHRTIDHLEDHLKTADTSFKSLQKFIKMALDELRSSP